MGVTKMAAMNNDRFMCVCGFMCEMNNIAPTECVAKIYCAFDTPFILDYNAYCGMNTMTFELCGCGFAMCIVFLRG